jgi:uncharacterized protein YecT (DUF1311 family)
MNEFWEDTPSMWIFRTTLIALAVSLGSLPTYAATARCEAAPQDDLGCMYEEYEQANKLLNFKLKNLLNRVQATEFGEYSPEEKKRRRAEVSNSIRTADGAWRMLLATECESLLRISFGHGLGADREMVRCKINRTYDRIKALSKDEAYEWLQ